MMLMLTQQETFLHQHPKITLLDCGTIMRKNFLKGLYFYIVKLVVMY